MPTLFGERLQALRQAARLTQEELAERTGLTAAGISAIERGLRKRTYPRTVNALADALGLTGEDRDAFKALVERPWPREPLPGPVAEAALPAQLTTFIGRDNDRARVRALLESGPLVTLVGPGGVGKTRLALEVAGEAAPVFSAGVRVADLGLVLDGGLVCYAVARSLGLLPRSSGPPLAVTAARIGDARLLLVLDNCEHVVHAAAQMAASLLAQCPRLVILATSREPLRVPGEVVVQVEPLTSSESAALFQARVAAAAGPGLHVAHRETVQHLLARLDGMPLAIELAAAALRVFSPDQILAQLDVSLGALTLGSRIAAPRHRSLDAAISWSYELLGPDERRLWRRLSVFVGGFEFDAAADVCSSPELPAERLPTALAALVDKSVVQRDERGRFRMLEVVRLFGRRLLSTSGEEAALVRRHRDWGASLAWPRLEVFWSPQEAAWRDRFELEQDNLRAALNACVHAGDARTGLAIFTGLYGLWQTRVGVSEGLRWFDILIALDGPEDDIRVLALGWAVWMRTLAGDLAGAVHAGREAERIAREIGDAAALGFALQNLAFASLAAQQTTTAIDLARRAVELHRSVANEWGIAASLHHLAYAYCVLGDRPRSREFAEEALRLCRAAGNQKFGMAVSILLGLLAWQDGEVTAAARLAAESIAAAGGAGDQWNVARALQLLGWTAAATGWPERTAMLFGGSQSLLDSIQDDSDLAQLPPQRDAENKARLALGEAGYAQWFAEGYSLSAADAVRYALDVGTRRPRTLRPASRHPNGAPT
jgi:predicted ATPase/DNA-binding XRE family transcriptional regulator